ncbi:TRAP transporter substrate-binding protein DctP [Selenomonas timonae]|uniref:TRAP transporter substrate-binding protein DctP n=1 Tax=Selenomonas timonae TaxID=2754044 RepID=A0A7G7VL93_9FIRM|nr:C4-dicarboxylate TRAP transporter substrate-binding protein [Selenomonas timonae]QNH54886.1 TRAP transporter substrate-binding protein DctP [Selenomonas timonae]
MKRILFGLLSTVLAITLLAGCGGQQSASKDGKVVIQVGYENNPGEPFDKGVNKWKELLEQKSNGTMTIETYPSSQLGSKNDLIDQMIAGQPVVTLADGAFYADRGVKDFGIVFGPFLFDNWDECWKLVKSQWYADKSKELEGKGLKLLGSNWVYGARHTLTTKPVNTVEDLKGLKIRVPNNGIQVKGFEVLGAVPTPMPLGDTYTALQQGTIDGVENPLPVLYNGKFQEVAKYLILDGHVKNFTTLVCGAQFFNSLTPEQQKLLVETCEEAGLYNNEQQAASEKEVLEKFRSEGVTIVEPSDTVLAGFRNASQKFYTLPDFGWSNGLYDTVKAAMK